MPHYDFPRPALTADVAAVAITAAGPRVLLIRRGSPPFEGQWALPGGFVNESERPEDAARRELAEETGLAFPGPLALVGVYGEPGRDPRGWTVSAVYLAVLDAEAQVSGDDDAAEADWFDAEHPPALAFDHQRIVADALRVFRAR